MELGLCQLFSAIGGDGEYTNDGSDGQGELFGGTENKARRLYETDETDTAVIAALHSETCPDFSVLPANTRLLFELSINAFDAIVHAWMSECPITAEIIRFGRKVLAASDAVTQAAGGEAEFDRRQAAELAAADRGDPDVITVQEAAYKVRHEIHRLLGLLRFCPNKDGVYIARCEPDHFVLPAMGPHFKNRFGETRWAIIDKKRRLCLDGTRGEMPALFAISDNAAFAENHTDGEWGNLWRHYHKTINNESRNNPDVQKRFMPRRYWKYLNEV